MSKPKTTIEMDIPATPITGVVRRLLPIIDSCYMPAALQSDLRLLLEAAMCWDIHTNQSALASPQEPQEPKP